MNQSMLLYITNVEKEGPFLKIWGQTNKKSSLEVEEALLRASKTFDDGKFCMKPNSLDVGVLCCAKYVDEKYYRARITSTALISDGMIEVCFLDYGNKDVVPIINLRSLECFNPSFISLQPLSTPFILAEVVSVGGEWNEHILEQIIKELRYVEVNFVTIAQAVKYYLIKASVNGIDLGNHLVRNNLMQKTSVHTQEAVLLSMIPRTSQPTPQVNQSLLQYKSLTLEPNSSHEVFVSYITDGPCHFTVQLKSYELSLTQLMKEINSVPLKPLEDTPIPGTVCLAKCVEDNHICRAVVTSEVDSQYNIFYVDFGNTELVPPENLYQISFKYVIPKIMAIRVSLAGIEKSTMTIEMQYAFKQFVDNRLLMMEVLPSKKKMVLPKCRMWDPETNIDVLEFLNHAAKLAYPDPVALHKGFTHPVKVCFVYSCNRFYVQIKGKETELEQLMADLQNFCNSGLAQNLTSVKESLPCCALFSYDQQWYRGLITKIENENITVRYVDYGNEEIVSLDMLRATEGKFMTVLKPQAIECALNGYQNMSEDLERDNKLEELILDQVFAMKVIDNIGGKMLVDLIDNSASTVSTLLLESMVAQTKMQTPPPRKFDNKKKFDEEFRKERSPKQFFRQDSSEQRPARSQKDDMHWKNSSRNSDTNSSASTESWRQENKGFQHKKDDDWNEKPRDNFRKDRGDFRGRNGGRNFNDKPPRFRNEHDDRGENNWTDKPRNRKTNDDWNDGANDNWGGKDDKTGSNWKNKNQAKNTNNDDWGQNNWDNDNAPRRKNFERDGNRNENDWKSKRRDANQGENNWGDGDNFRNTNRRDGESKSEWNKKPNAGDDWNSRKNTKNFNDKNYGGYDNDRGGFKKKTYNKDGSDFGGSGSEKSFGKGPRTSSRNENRPQRAERKYDANVSDNSWNVSTVVPSVIDCASNDATFKTIDMTGKQENVVISWFHNPNNFFCQLVESQEHFKKLMNDIQEFYKGRPTGNCVKGAPAIGLFPEDNVLYRAKILDVVGYNLYKIYYVDFGNVSVVNKVWPIENKFMETPMQAIPCGLNGIEPIDGNWQSPDDFSRYFEKESLKCDFVLFENEKFLVNLTSDTGNIGEQLVYDGIAKYSQTIVIDFEINLLVGQQFRAMLTSVNDLSDFSMMLQSGIKLNCCAHNLSEATEKNEDLLKQNLDQILIVYADDYVNDKMVVTLYDVSGNKLNILNPDEGAFDTVEPLCPYLVTKSVINGFVPYVSETSVVIQPTECATNIENLLEAMFEYYENLPLENTIVPEEDYLYAVKSEDENWYRGRVTSFDDEKAKVTYIDYGNSEEVLLSSLRELVNDFFQWDSLALLVKTKIPTSEFFEQDVTASVYYGETSWESSDITLSNQTIERSSTVLQSAPEDNTPVENFIETSSPLNESTIQPATTDEMTESSLAPSGESVEFKTMNEVSSSSGICVSETSGQSIVLSHSDSPNEFYIQLTDTLIAIDELQQKIQEQIESMETLESPSIGGYCAAPYSVDHQWYRSQILDADDDITTVRFIDYGNTDVIDNKTTRIKTLTSELLSLEVYATKCRLKIKPIEEEWSKAATDRFEELTLVEDLKVEFIDQDEKTNYVELYSNGENVKNILIRENLALLDDNVVLEGKLTGFICHINSPTEFWIQLESCCAELEWIAEQLSNAESFPDLEDLTPGSLCAAMYPDDEMWYRARILSNTVAGIEVLFIDYGNTCTCENLKQLPEDLAIAHTLAEKCCLQIPDGLLNWSVDSTEKFKELAAEGQTVFTIKKLSTGETSTVELFINGDNVCDKLMPITENGYVTEVESLESFSLKKDDVVSKDKYKLEKIPGVEYNEEILDKFIEINKEGTTLYHIEYLSNNTVNLYLDHFNDIRNELKKLLIPNIKENVLVSATETSELEEMNSGEKLNQDTEIPEEKLDSSTEILEEKLNRDTGVLEEKLDKDVEIHEELSRESEISGENTEILKENTEIPEENLERDNDISEERLKRDTEISGEKLDEDMKISEEKLVRESEMSEENKDKEISEEKLDENKEILEISDMLSKNISEVNQEKIECPDKSELSSNLDSCMIHLETSPELTESSDHEEINEADVDKSNSDRVHNESSSIADQEKIESSYHQKINESDTKKSNYSSEIEPDSESAEEQEKIAFLNQDDVDNTNSSCKVIFEIHSENSSLEEQKIVESSDHEDIEDSKIERKLSCEILSNSEVKPIVLYCTKCEPTIIESNEKPIESKNSLPQKLDNEAIKSEEISPEIQNMENPSVEIQHLNTETKEKDSKNESKNTNIPKSDVLNESSKMGGVKSQTVAVEFQEEIILSFSTPENIGVGDEDVSEDGTEN